MLHPYLLVIVQNKKATPWFFSSGHIPFEKTKSGQAFYSLSSAKPTFVESGWKTSLSPFSFFRQTLWLNLVIQTTYKRNTRIQAFLSQIS